MTESSLPDRLKARTHMLTFAESALESPLESAHYTPELVDSTTNFMRVGQLPVLNMFNISTPIQLADSRQQTIVIVG